MSDIATTIEQSRHLLELGLDPNTADMCWITENHGVTYHKCPVAMPWRNYTAKEFYLPAWSLSALLDVMPKKIEIDRESYEDIYVLTIEYTGDDNNPEISYMSGEFEYVHFTSAKTTLLAAYEMVCWLLERGIIKKGEQQ